MGYMELKEIEGCDIGTANLDEPIRALQGYDYWHCPRCKRILDFEDGHIVHKCKSCAQAIEWKSKTPMLDKMLVIQRQSEVCGEFLDWFLQKYTVFEKMKKRESSFNNADGTGDYINKERLLAEFFEIDLEEVERERQFILKSL